MSMGEFYVTIQNMQRNLEVDSEATSKPFGCDRVEEKHWD